MKTIKLIVEYDGTEFSGWQLQPERRTVQGEIESALESLTGEQIRVVGSGRTDAGVHALGQVVSFRSNRDLPVSAFRDGLNSYLPDDVRVLSAEIVSDSFDARRDAIRRTYRYIFSKRERVIGRNYSWYPGSRLDLRKLKRVSRNLLGEKDFSSFCKNDDDCTTRVFTIKWREMEEEIHFEISAVRFLHNMIRIILGTLLEVNRGRITPKRFKEIIDYRDRTMAGPTIPPHGLYLLRVEYNK